MELNEGDESNFRSPAEHIIARHNINKELIPGLFSSGGKKSAIYGEMSVQACTILLYLLN